MRLLLLLHITGGSPRALSVAAYCTECGDILQHYNDVIMTTMASQVTSLTVVYSTVYSDADHRKHQSFSLAFVWGIRRDRWIPRTKCQLRGKCLHLMTSSWNKHDRQWPNLEMHTKIMGAKNRCRNGTWTTNLRILATNPNSLNERIS